MGEGGGTPDDLTHSHVFLCFSLPGADLRLVERTDRDHSVTFVPFIRMMGNGDKEGASPAGEVKTQKKDP